MGPGRNIEQNRLHRDIAENAGKKGQDGRATSSCFISFRAGFDPGKPLWLTETAESGCGGNPGASSFLDSFRYLDQLGRLAKRGVQVVAHNTLDASDYPLIDEATLTPRPDYWAALLWRKLMGTKVLDAGAEGGSLRLYAHCLRGTPGGLRFWRPGGRPIRPADKTGSAAQTSHNAATLRR